jgi:hypothetical protein
MEADGERANDDRIAFLIWPTGKIDKTPRKLGVFPPSLRLYQLAWTVNKIFQWGAEIRK